MVRRLLLFAILSLFATQAAAQVPAPPAQRPMAKAIAITPIYVSAPPNLTLGPIRTAAVGTVFLVLGEKGDWVNVQFNDPDYGARVGWVDKKLIAILENPALKPTDLSVKPDPPPTVSQPAPTPRGNATATQAAGGPQNAPARRGFTLLLDMGVGFQTDDGLEESATGLGGLNLGIGGFLNEDVALMFRITGTNVWYDFGFLGKVQQISGVAGPSVQYWVSDRFTVEGGVGVGYWVTASNQEQAVGLILGARAVVFDGGRHNLLVGAEYAPAFTSSGTVHNFGITFGYQYHR